MSSFSHAPWQTISTRYATILETAIERRIVASMTNFYDEFLSPENADVRLLPYHEGDLWVDVAEDILEVPKFT